MRGSPMLAAVMVGLWSAPSWAVTEDNFLARTTGDMIALCAADRSDPLRVAAIHFCEGFLLGAFQYHQAVSAATGKGRACLPNPPPTRDQGVAQFVSWVQAHPQYMSEKPVDTMYRFITTTWPCRT